MGEGTLERGLGKFSHTHLPNTSVPEKLSQNLEPTAICFFTPSLLQAQRAPGLCQVLSSLRLLRGLTSWLCLHPRRAVLKCPDHPWLSSLNAVELRLRLGTCSVSQNQTLFPPLELRGWPGPLLCTAGTMACGLVNSRALSRAGSALDH